MIAINPWQCTEPGLTWVHLLHILLSLPAHFALDTPALCLHIHQVIPASGPLHLPVSLPGIGKALHLAPGIRSGLPPCCCHLGTASHLAQNMRGLHRSPPPREWGVTWRDQQVPGTQ